jgi:hypothetical protein
MLESPTAHEARFFGAWVHDDNLGSRADAEALTGRLTAQEAAYASPAQLRSLPHRVVPWPGALLERAPSAHRPLEVQVHVKDGDRWRTTAHRAEPGPWGRALAVLPVDVDDLTELTVQLGDVDAVLRLDRVRIACETQRGAFEAVFEPHDRTLRAVVTDALSAIPGVRGLYAARAGAPHLRWRPADRRSRGDASDPIRHVLVVVAFSLLPATGDLDTPEPPRRRARRSPFR